MTRGRRFKSCPRYKEKHQVRGGFRRNPEVASDPFRGLMSAECQQISMLIERTRATWQAYDSDLLAIDPEVALSGGDRDANAEDRVV